MLQTTDGFLLYSTQVVEEQIATISLVLTVFQVPTYLV